MAARYRHGSGVGARAPPAPRRRVSNGRIPARSGTVALATARSTSGSSRRPQPQLANHPAVAARIPDVSGSSARSKRTGRLAEGHSTVTPESSGCRRYPRQFPHRGQNDFFVVPFYVLTIKNTIQPLLWVIFSELDYAA